MTEIVTTYSDIMPGKSIPIDRDLFYRESILRSDAGLPPDRYVEVVHIFLFNEHHELIIQKRSKEKKHNPNLLDKSIGGHVQYGDNPNLTAMIETIQELQTPSIVLEDESDFLRTFSVLKDYITTSAIMQYISTEDLHSRKIIDGREVTLGNRVHTYFGVYAGRVKNVDKEAKGILYYSLDDLEEELATHPEIFTYDLRDVMMRLRGLMDDFLTRIA